MKLNIVQTFMAISIATVLAGFGCNNCAGVLPTPVIPTDSDKCAAACEKLVSLGCEEGNPVQVPLSSDDCILHGKKVSKVDAGSICEVPCSTFCDDTQNTGVWLNPTCVIENVTKCSDLETLCAPGK